jgi:hypothetical protein
LYYRKDETDDGAKSDVTTGKKTFYDTLPGSLKTEVLVRLAEQKDIEEEQVNHLIKKLNLLKYPFNAAKIKELKSLA